MIEPLTEPLDELGEGVTWDDASSLLWWVDIRRHLVRRLDPSDGSTAQWRLDEPVGSLALRPGPELLVAIGRSIAELDPATGDVRTRIEDLDADSGNRMNDGRADPQGRFWVGTMDDAERRRSGALYRIDPDWSTHRIMEGLDIPNAISFSPDGSVMYFTETRDRLIVALDLAEDGTVRGRRVFVEVEGPGSPDGACVDAEGHLWSAEYGGSRVVRYAPDGTVDRVVEVPAPNVTCPVLGGTTLYVTTARQGMSPTDLADHPLAGALFAVDVGVEALPTWRFGG